MSLADQQRAQPICQHCARLYAENADLKRRLEEAANDFAAIEKALNGESSDALCVLGQKGRAIFERAEKAEAELAEAREEYKNAAGLVAYQVERISKQDTELVKARAELAREPTWLCADCIQQWRMNRTAFGEPDFVGSEDAITQSEPVTLPDGTWNPRYRKPEPPKPQAYIVLPVSETWNAERVLADLKDDWTQEYIDSLLPPAVREELADSARLTRREEARERILKIINGAVLRGGVEGAANAALDALMGEGK